MPSIIARERKGSIGILTSKFPIAVIFSVLSRHPIIFINYTEAFKSLS